MKKLITRVLSVYVATHRHSRVTNTLMKISNLVRCAYFNSSNHDIRSNGESRALENGYRCYSDSTKPFVIFDVGANEGRWSEIALNLCQNCEIHLFEIVPDTRDILKTNIGNRDNIVINDLGLSDAEQEVKIKFYPENNTGSSEYDLPWGAKHVVISAKCVRGDEYMEKNGIERINYLKIDVEGADYKVLKGFEHALKEQRIDFIQFEYNKAAVLSKRLLKDFYDLLEAYGYDIGRVLPNKVDFKEYDLFVDENLLQSNFFAIIKDLRKSYEKA